MCGLESVDIDTSVARNFEDYFVLNVWRLLKLFALSSEVASYLVVAPKELVE